MRTSLLQGITRIHHSSPTISARQESRQINAVMRRLTSALVVVTWCLSLSGHAEEIDVLIKGVDDGIKTSKQQDRAEAIMNAKLQGIERAGVEVSSITQIVNFKLKYDKVESKAQAILLPGFQVLDLGYQPDDTYLVVLSGRVKTGESKPEKVKLAVGGETMLSAVIADPYQYLDTSFVITGYVKPDATAYIGGYRDATKSHYALWFSEMAFYEPGAIPSILEHLTVLADRQIAKPLIDAIIEVQQQGRGGKVVRLKVALKERAFWNYKKEMAQYNELVELVDWQYRTQDNSAWTDWELAGKSTGYSEAFSKVVDFFKSE